MSNISNRIQESEVNTSQNRWKDRIIRASVASLVAIGAVTVIYLFAGFVLDVSRFDQTSGGYEYPHEGWTGTPLQFDEWLSTSEGMYHRGRVIDLYADCSTGMVSWSFLGMGQVDWRQFSDRAKAVHQPQVACSERGFDTSAWDAIGS